MPGSTSTTGAAGVDDATVVGVVVVGGGGEKVANPEGNADVADESIDSSAFDAVESTGTLPADGTTDG